MSEIEEKEAILAFLDGVRKNVERSVDIKGKIKMERPSLHPVYQNPLPPTWAGENHLRYTFELDIVIPQISDETPKVINDA